MASPNYNYEARSLRGPAYTGRGPATPHCLKHVEPDTDVVVALFVRQRRRLVKKNTRNDTESVQYVTRVIIAGMMRDRG